VTDNPLPRAAMQAGETPSPSTAMRPDRSTRSEGLVEQAIASAARSTSVDFDFLLAQAQIESSMNPQAKAPSSSATGLYQFIESTWLAVMKRHGPRFGLGAVADQIALGRGGSARIGDPAARRAILDLREDPEIAALMAAGLAEDNRAKLMPVLGRQPDHTELYLAHFLGAGGAARFLAQLQTDPSQSAPALFRRSASANRSIFHEPGGAARSLAGVMDHLDSKMSRALAHVRPGETRLAASAGARAMPAPSVSAALLQTAALTLPEQPRTAISLALTLPGASSSAEIAPNPAFVSASSPAGLAPRSARASLPPLAPASPPPPLRQAGRAGAGSMASLFASGLGDPALGGAMSDAGAAQVRRAYAQLRAMGF